MSMTVREKLKVINQQTRQLIGIYRNSAKRAGISENEFLIWYALVLANENYSQKDIYSLWALPKQTVNTIICKLLKSGALFLHTISGTRNQKCIQLTDTGKQYGERMVFPIYQAEQRAFMKLTKQEQTEYAYLHEKYICLLNEEVGKEGE